MIKLRTEHIVWMRIMRDGQIVDEGNALGMGYRFPTKHQARLEAERIARSDRYSNPASGRELQVYIVPTPQGAFQRNEALWERIEVPA